MARKQFVSSKKNAPSRAVSSKEAALHGRASPEANGESTYTPNSPTSSNASMLYSSEEPEDDDDDDDDDDDVDSRSMDDDSEVPQNVEVLPASVGRGKQLRFPAVVSRGKESRMLFDGSHDENSDSDDSLLSIASDEEDEDKNSQEDVTMAKPVSTTMTTTAAAPESPVANNSHSDASPYPIAGSRARKRHRPDSGYYKRMSTYVRDCLLSVRDGAENAAVFSEDVHREFRRKLSAGAVERVAWKESSPRTEPPKSVDSAKPKEPPASRPEKKEVSKKEHRTKEQRSSESKSSKSSSSSRRKSSSSSRVKESEDTGRRKENESAKENDKKSRVAVSEDPAKSSSAVESNGSKKSSKKSDSSSSKNGSAAALCSSCQKKIAGENDKKEQPQQLPQREMKTTGTNTDAPIKEERSTIKTEPIKAEPVVEIGSFTIPIITGQDVTKLRIEAGKLNDEARNLKHEGNRRGAAEPGAAGQIAQGKCYLRSSAKFFQHALKLADVKQAYKELKDESHARTYGEYSVRTLSQTSTLIESTIRMFQGAGNTRLVALGYKMASVVHLTIYRLQHLKLFSLYSDLFTPGRSPDSRQNGTTPPITSNGADNREAAVRTHLLKEMEHTLRGFEMWRRYEACNVSVLPKITNPAVTDLNVFFEELSAELGDA